jgi:hypothetical protein
LYDEKLVEALNVLDAMLRSPEALTGLLEAAGTVALERAGVILDSRVSRGKRRARQRFRGRA